MKKTVTMLLVLCLLAASLTGCQKEKLSVKENMTIPTAEPGMNVSLDEYLADVKAQSDAIKYSLENDILTQVDMNLKSEELLALWETALTKVLDNAAKVLPEDEMAKLTAEQNAWRESTDKAVEAAGKEVEGGSMYPLVVNGTAAALAEARMYEIYELLK